MSLIVRDREALVHGIATELDKPSIYMGGPSVSSRRKAERIVALLPDYLGAVEEHRAFVAALTEALTAHGVPAMPSWREAIDYLARHGGQ